jgi:hypothetical protein
MYIICSLERCGNVTIVATVITVVAVGVSRSDPDDAEWDDGGLDGIIDGT